MEDFDHLLSEVNLEEICCHTSTNKPAKTAFYLTPLKKPKDICWYSEVPVGNNALSQQCINCALAQESKDTKQIIPCVSLVQQECSKMELMINLLYQEQDTEV